jgi:hypothetical protein
MPIDSSPHAEHLSNVSRNARKVSRDQAVAHRLKVAISNDDAQGRKRPRSQGTVRRKREYTWVLLGSMRRLTVCRHHVDIVLDQDHGYVEVRLQKASKSVSQWPSVETEQLVFNRP